MSSTNNTQTQPVAPDKAPLAFWSMSPDQLPPDLRTPAQGLTDAEAQQRLARGGGGLHGGPQNTSSLLLLLSQFKSPIILVLIFASILSFFLKDAADGGIILTIIFVSGALGFWQERGAADAVKKLLAIVQVKATCQRGGKSIEVPTESVVAGDIILLSAGGAIPADSLILDSTDLFVNEATLTGETFPVEKLAGVLPAKTALAQRTNTLFMGTYVVSGTARVLAVRTGRDTEFGQVSQTLAHKSPETEFERGIRRFGYLLMQITLLMVLAILAVNVSLGRPVLDSLLFSLALAVGLTPQLLPAIISINLAHGAKRMATEKVIVKRLASIENFGSMDVLCTDKTGTLTEGTVKLHGAVDMDGKDSDSVLRLAFLNATFQSGYANPIDQAIVAYQPRDVSAYTKLDEEPYDFLRKRLSVLVAEKQPGQPEIHLMVTKGALANVLDVCTNAQTVAGVVPLGPLRAQIQSQFETLSGQGFR
ncbi:MAG: HAD-IC family P-type ATPase, partial [Armatimonadota bacterium]|nr:HAD-IC family P-type ATPase [Armatimonadota bacterium]